MPNVQDIKTELMIDAHRTRYSVHPGSTKMCRNLKNELSLIRVSLTFLKFHFMYNNISFVEIGRNMWIGFGELLR